MCYVISSFCYKRFQLRFEHSVMDKAWVHLNRVDPGYERGASKFVRDVASAMGGVDVIVCPCIDCRNIVRHSASVVLDHLVTRVWRRVIRCGLIGIYMES